MTLITAAKETIKLRWFLSIAFRIPTVRDFASLARAHERVHVHNIRVLPQTMFDRKIYVRFLLNEDDDIFLLYNFGVKMMAFKLHMKLLSYVGEH